jgi:hypothetical protein
LVAIPVEKVCVKCGGDPKPMSAFAKQASRADGTLNVCKECRKKYNKKKEKTLNPDDEIVIRDYVPAFDDSADALRTMPALVDDEDTEDMTYDANGAMRPGLTRDQVANEEIDEEPGEDQSPNGEQGQDDDTEEHGRPEEEAITPEIMPPVNDSPAQLTIADAGVKVTLNHSQAARLVRKIRTNVDETRKLLLTLELGDGVAALGYKDWKDLFAHEFPESSRSDMYRQLQAGRAEMLVLDVTPEETGKVSESVLRPLTRLKTNEDKLRAWHMANETAKEQDQKITAVVVQAACDIIAPPAPKHQQDNKPKVSDAPTIVEGEYDPHEKGLALRINIPGIGFEVVIASLEQLRDWGVIE